MTEQNHALAERYVIGALISAPDVLRAVQEEVTPDDFEDQRLGAIFAGIAGMVAQRTPVDLLSVSDMLPAWDVRGIDFADLATLTGLVTTIKTAAYHARMVKEASLRRALSIIGQRIQQPGDVGATLSNAITELTDLRDRDSGPARGLRMLRDVLAVSEAEDEYDWVIEGLIERRDRLMLTGSEGGGKSTLLRQIAILASAGIHPFRFHRIAPVRVLVVDVENSERQWRRAVRKVAAHAAERGVRDPQDVVAIECVPRMDITNAAELGKVHRMIDQARPDIMLIGPLYRLTKGSITNDDDAAPVLTALDSLRDRGLAMLIEAHAGHATSQAGERDLRPRGSSALLGWPEFGLGIRPHKTGRGAFQVVRWRGDRDQREWPTVLSRGGYSQIWPWEPTAVLS